MKWGQRLMISMNILYGMIRNAYDFHFAATNPFKHLQKEINIGGETFHYFDIASFEEYSEYSSK
jgi:hypothetical protein